VIPDGRTHCALIGGWPVKSMNNGHFISKIFGKVMQEALTKEIEIIHT
jgi:hypothetical protein